MSTSVRASLVIASLIIAAFVLIFGPQALAPKNIPVAAIPSAPPAATTSLAPPVPMAPVAPSPTLVPFPEILQGPMPADQPIPVWKLPPPPIAAIPVAPVAAVPPGPARGTAKPIEDRQAVEAIKLAVEPLLLSIQPARLVDPADPNIKRVATNVRALLIAGESISDPRLHWKSPEMTPAIDFLTTASPTDWRVKARRAMALARLPHGKMVAANKLMAVDRDAILTAVPIIPAPVVPGAPAPLLLDTPDLHLLTSAFDDLSNAGIEIPIAFWKYSDRNWRAAQTPVGTWPLPAAFPPASISGTAEGTAMIAAIKHNVDSNIQLVAKPDRNLDLGLAALDARFVATFPEDMGLDAFTCLGDYTGRQFFGARSWHEDITAELLATQNPGGLWRPAGRDPEEATALAMAFLANARRPMFVSKLEHSGNWNARPMDAANLTTRCSKLFDWTMQWQTVNFGQPVSEWLKSPVLLITGSGDPKFTAPELEKLRAYVEAGGIIFSSADGGNKEFFDAVRKYSTQITDGMYEMRTLPPTHALYTSDLWEKLKSPMPLYDISNGVRELWVHAGADLGATWQREQYASQDHWVLPANVWLYATGKVQPHSAFADPFVPPIAPKIKIAVARIEFPENDDPEPGAWPRLKQRLAAKGVADLTVTKFKIAALNVQNFPIAHMTGATRFTLTPQEIAALQNYIVNGGTLILEAAGGSKNFAKSATDLMTQLAPAVPPTPVAKDELVYLNEKRTGIVGNRTKDPYEPEMRKYSNRLHMKHGTGEFLAVRRPDDTPMILFSPFDLTSGLLGTNTWGIDGYTPDSSELLMTNVLLWLGKPTAPATAP